MPADNTEGAHRRAALVQADVTAARPGGDLLDRRADETNTGARPDRSGVTEKRGLLGAAGLSALLAGLTALVLSVGPGSSQYPIHQLTSPPVVFSVLAIISAAAVLAPISFHHRGDTYLFVLGEIPLLLGLAFASPLILVLSRAAGETIAFGLVRRQTPLKLSFNLSSGALAAGIASVIFREALGHHIPASPVGWGAGAAALAAGTLIARLSLHGVIRLNGQRLPHSTAYGTSVHILLFGASAGLALVVLDAAWWNPWAVVPLILVGGLIVVAYRGYLRLTDRFGALQRLYEFSRALAGTYLEPAGTSWAVLEHLRAVMRSRRAQLFLLEESGRLRRFSLDKGARYGPEVLDSATESIVTSSISERRAILRLGQPGLSGRAVEQDILVGDYREAMIAPLVSGDQTIGALAALDREGELDPFDKDDLLLFEALAGHASSGLDRARLVEELRHEAESKSHQATHDSLTGLPNRALFLSRAAGLLSGTGRIAVALLDLDRFKDVNDTLGHEMGDRLLCEVAERLVRAASGRASVARLGGDEFALVVSNITGPEEAIGIVRDLDAEVSRPVKIDGLSLAVTASAGVALAPENGDNVALLLQRADIAMYLAKERRSGIELYSANRDQSMQRRLMLGGQLVQALDAGDQLSLMYQPIARLTSGEVIRVEALARWLHPTLGWIPAAEFIGLAEQMGLIGEITEFVFSEACAQSGHWRRIGLPVGLAINLSGRLLSDAGLVDRVARHLAEHDIPPRSLTLELTETEVMADLGEASGVLNEFAKLGVRIAVDDYGTGYSSLAYLHRLPVQELKIDRSFVTNLADDPSNAIIVRSSIAMAHSLGLSVVAEGAEDEVTCAILADAGCDAVQGYYLSHPHKGSEVEKWLLSGARLEFSREIPPLRPLRVVPGSTDHGPADAGGVRETGT